MDIKEKIAWKIAFMLPWSVVLFVVVRAFSWTSTHECSNKDVDDINYSAVYKSIKKLASTKK